MPTLIESFWDDLRTAIVTVWPETSENFRAIQVERLNWDEQILDANITTPYVIIHEPPFTPSENYSVDTLTYETPVMFYYITDSKDSGGDVGATLEAKMYAMQVWLRSAASDAAFICIQVLDDNLMIDVSEQNALNSSMFSSDLPYNAASVSFTALWGVLPS